MDSWLPDYSQRLVSSAGEDCSVPCSVSWSGRVTSYCQGHPKVVPEIIAQRVKEIARVLARICVTVRLWALRRTPGYFSTQRQGVGFCTLSSSHRSSREPVSSSDSGSLAVHHGNIKVKFRLLKAWWQAEGALLGVPAEKAPLRHSALCWRQGGSRFWGGLKRE